MRCRILEISLLEHFPNGSEHLDELIHRTGHQNNAGRRQMVEVVAEGLAGQHIAFGKSHCARRDAAAVIVCIEMMTSYFSFERRRKLRPSSLTSVTPGCSNKPPQ